MKDKNGKQLQVGNMVIAFLGLSTSTTCIGEVMGRFLDSTLIRVKTAKDKHTYLFTESELQYISKEDNPEYFI